MGILRVSFVYCIWMVVRGKGRLQFALALLLVFTPVVVFYTALLRTFVAIPLIDDYTALLRFSLQWHETVGIGRRALLLLRTQDGDYKLWLDHLCTAADVAWTGHLHLGLWMWVGNLLPLPLLWLLWRHARPQEPVLATRLLHFAPVTFLLFQLNYAETVNWAMAGLQNVGVLVGSLFGIHLLLQRRRSTDALAAMCFLFAVAASANGFLLAPIAVWLLWQRQEYASALLWCALTTGLILAYRDGLVLVPKHRVGIGAYVRFFLSLCGGGVETMRRQPVPGAGIVLGAMLLLAMVLCVRKGVARTAPFAFWSAVWLLLTALLITAGRAGFGPTVALAGRYKLYCDLLLVFTWLLAGPLLQAHRLRRAWFAAALIASVVIGSLSTMAGARLLQERTQDLRNGARAFQESNGRLPPLSYPEEAHASPSPYETFAAVVLKDVELQGIYTLPAMEPAAVPRR